MENIRVNYIYRDKEIQYAILGIILLPLYIKLMSQISVIISFPTIITTIVYYGGIWLLIAIYTVKNMNVLVFNTVQIGILLFTFAVFCSVMGGTGFEYIFKYDVQELITFQPTTLFFTSMYMILGISVQDFDSFTMRLHTISKIGVLFGLMIYCFGLLSGNVLHYDDMNYAYALCLMVCSLIACYTREDWIFVVIGVLCLLLAGTRGPLVCVMIAFLLKGFTGGKSIQKNLHRIILGIIFIIALYSGVLVWILQKLIGVLSSFGITELRILNYMNDGMIMDSSGRDNLSATIIDAIIKRPVLGYGVGADRMLLPKSAYCHNILLEIAVSVGVIIGAVVLIWIIYRFTKMLIHKNKSYKSIAIAFFAGIFVKLLLSSSILYSTELFIFLGMSVVATGRVKWKNPLL